MKKYFVFESKGKRFVVPGPDADRARIAAKKLAGADWTGKAKLVGVQMGGAN